MSDASTPPPHSPSSQGSFDEVISGQQIWNFILRNRWLLVGCTALGLGLAWSMNARSVPIYEATATLRVSDTSRGDFGIFDPLLPMNAYREVETEMEILRSRSIREQVVRELGLQMGLVAPRGLPRDSVVQDIFIESWAPAGAYRLDRLDDGAFSVTHLRDEVEMGRYRPGERVALEGASFELKELDPGVTSVTLRMAGFDQAVRALQGGVRVTRPQRDVNVISITYRSPVSRLVHQVPNAVARTFIGQRQQIRRTEARSTVSFLQEQLDTISLQLFEAEANMQAFREGEQVVSLEAQASAQVTRLVQMQAERNSIDAERSALQSLLTEIQREEAFLEPNQPSPYRRLIAFPSLLGSSATSELLRSLNQADNTRSELLQRQTMENPDVQNLTQRIRELEEQLRSMSTTYLEGLGRQVTSLDESLGRFGQELERIPGREVQFARLQRQSRTLEELFNLLQTRLKEAEIAEAVEDAAVRTVDPAIFLNRPVSPRRTRNLALGLLLGLSLGGGLSVLREQLDDAVHTEDHLARASGGTPVLGWIPEFNANGLGRLKNGKGATKSLPVVHDPRSPISEAYRTLRTNFTFVRPDRPPKTLMITSALPGDGKSTTAANLAAALASQGQSVVLIDADMRKGVLHNYVGFPNPVPGLSDLLAKGEGLNEAIHSFPDVAPGLHFIAKGSTPPNPAELLGSGRMKALLERLSERFHHVILDSPPLVVVTDAQVLATLVDGVVVVARANETPKGAVTHAMGQLDRVRASVLGTVLNGINAQRDGRYDGSYRVYRQYEKYYS